MIVTIYLVLCLAGQCETIRPAEWPPQASLMQCIIYGQHFASDWQRAHPAYAAHELRGWRCETGEPA